MREKFLTLLVVPHDERNVRRLRLSYRRLRVYAGIAILLGVCALGAVLTWGMVASRAARVEVLERQNRQLANENAKVSEIATNLERSEEAYRQIRDMAGLPRDGSGTAIEQASAIDLPSGAPSGERPPELQGRPGPEPSGWPLTIKGFVTAVFTGAQGHTGVDIAVPANTPVVATAAGTVSEAGTDDVYGAYVVLTHAGGTETMYAHNGPLLVERGEEVARGDIIAYSGNSGESTAPHLHYEVRRGGAPIDPTTFLR
jgi:murein DD-endopeptidase MepM/ murein hydrolase activator NlpD